MGRINNRPDNTRQHEKEFSEMTKRLGVGGGGNRNNTKSPNEYRKYDPSASRTRNTNQTDHPHSYNSAVRKSYVKPDNTESFKAPESHTGLFKEELIKSIKEVQGERTDVTMNYSIGDRKEETGIVYIKVSIKSTSNEKKNEDILFYYIENRRVNPKKLPRKHEYDAVITILNQGTGAVLFNRFGMTVIPDSKKYIDDILTRSVDHVVS